MKYFRNFTVGCHDVDVNNNIRPSALLGIMQETANMQMKDVKPSYMELFQEGKAFIVTRMIIEIYHQLNQFDDVRAATWCSGEKAATFYRCYSVERDGVLMATAYSEWTVVNRNTGGICRTSEVDISSYPRDDEAEQKLPHRFKSSSNTDDYEKICTRKVLYSDVDMNLHMNNANYPDILWNCIPDIRDKEVTSVSLRFRKEAPLDGDMDIYMRRAGEEETTDSRAEEEYQFLTKVARGTNIEGIVGVKSVK